MRINPPVVEISKENPYENDLFQRQSYGDSISAALRNINERIVLCIDAPWGEGKTTFAHMWRTALSNESISTIYYDAYEHDFSDDPFTSFCAEIVSVIEEKFSSDPDIKVLKTQFLDKAKKLGSKLLSAGIRTGVKVLSLNVFGEDEIKDLIELGKISTETKADSLYNAMGDAILEYQGRKESMGQFKEVLSELGAAIQTKQGFPLVIIVDELDRCRPDYAFGLLERIKHLFSVESVCFVVFANTNQLEEYVRFNYGLGVDARNYLHKFFTLTSKLPLNKDDPYSSYTKIYYQFLLEHFELADRDHMRRIPHRLFEYYRVSLREMERVFSLLSLYCAQDGPSRKNFEEIVTFLAIMYIKYPEVFDKLSRGQMTFSDLMNESEIGLILSYDYPDFAGDWFIDFLQFLTLPQNEFEENRDSKKEFKMYERNIYKMGIERELVIPLLCDQLVRFKN